MPTYKEIPSRTTELLAQYRRIREEQGAQSANALSIRNKIASLNTRLVYKITHRLHQNVREPYKDLEQVGQIGLLRAIENYDLSRGLAFSSYAVPKIRGEILHYLRDKTHPVKIPRKLQELYSKGQTAKRQLSLQTGRFPTEAELAQSLGVSPSDWQNCQKAHSANLVKDIDECKESEHEVYTLEVERDFSWQAEMRKLQAALAQIGAEKSEAILAVFSGEVGAARKSAKSSSRSIAFQEGLENLALAIGY